MPNKNQNSQPSTKHKHIETLSMKHTLSDWLTYMQGIHVSAIDMGLSRVLPVAQKLGIIDSARHAYVFTVAGTNGKGSTTSVIAEICQQAGYKTGLYQSPELLEFNERVRISGQPAADTDLIQAFAQVDHARQACELSLSFFEITTLAAFLIFAQAECDVWVLEVGLGGRLDVVNIIDPDVAVITNIGIDHVDWLGDTRESIGYEKAGILRHGIPLIYGEQANIQNSSKNDQQNSAENQQITKNADNPMPASVQKRIEEMAVHCYQLNKDYAFICEQVDKQSDGQNHRQSDEQPGVWQFSTASISMQLPKPKLSPINTANAIASVLASSLNIQQTHIAAAMDSVQLAGRFDYRHLLGRRWLFDVAHNEHGVNFFLQQLLPQLPNLMNPSKDKNTETAQQSNQHTGKIVMVFSMLADKDMAAVVKQLQQVDWASYFSALHSPAHSSLHWHIAPLDHHRAASKDVLQKVLATYVDSPYLSVYTNMAAATDAVIQSTTAKDLILVCGSFHTIKECLLRLKQLSNH